MLTSFKQTVVKLLVDIILFTFAWFSSFGLRFGGDIPPEYLEHFQKYLGLAILTKLLFFFLLGAYKSVWRYTSLNDLLLLVRAIVMSWSLLAIMIFALLRDTRFSLGVSIIDAVLTLVFTGGMRLMPRVLRETIDPELMSHLPRGLRRWFLEERTVPRTPTLVVGAGDAGETLLRLLRKGEVRGYRPIGLVDDDPRKQGVKIHGVPVMGTTEDIPHLIETLRCTVVLIAIPSVRRDALRRIASLCRQTPVKMRILPDLKSLISGESRLSDIRELDIEALLGREKVDLQIEETAAYLEGRRVLVTGAGGSIGSELCRQILRFDPAEVVLLGRGENSIFKIHSELYRTGTGARLQQVIGDVINRSKLLGVCTRFHPEIVFHAGADKHVPLMELNPDEAVLNNILGTKNVLEIADEIGVERVVCISTDKAVKPTSVMGCCKRVAELLIQMGTYHNTKAVAVRFGNVLGSRGSVIPFFEDQIANGGPVTVTDKNVSRYFMTIPEAVQLVIQAGAMAQGGEIFILEMGDPVRIEDLAKNIIRYHGYEPGVEIPIQFTGLRPGEKLHEELIVPGEKVNRTHHPKILRVEGAAQTTDGDVLLAAVKLLTELAVRMDDAGIRETLRKLVPEYEAYPSPSVKSVKVRTE